MNKTLLLTTAFLLLVSPVLSAVPDDRGVFLSVRGKVQIQKEGRRARNARVDSIVAKGERVAAEKGAEAVLRMADGSEIRVEPGTEFEIASLETASKDTSVKLKLLAGKLWAQVKKLATRRSTFEIESGGVVCGVRGTEYSVEFDPSSGRTDLFVKEGKVWVLSDGKTFDFGAGQTGRFTKGKPDDDAGKDRPRRRADAERKERFRVQDPQDGPGPRLRHRFSPFYGMGGSRLEAVGSLTGPLEETGGIADQTNDDNLLGLGAHRVIIFPVYPEN